MFRGFYAFPQTIKGVAPSRSLEYNTAMTIDVFSYGSNMCLERIRDRVPSADVVGCGHVVGRRLAFHKVGVDGSAKADAFHSADPTHRIFGVIMRIARKEKPVLDEYESLGIGYDEERVNVTLHNGDSHQAWVYVARREMIDPTLKPFCWYREFVLAGARQHGLPGEYVRELEQHDFVTDSDHERRRQNFGLIGL